MVNAQEWLDINYPEIEKRTNIEKLDIKDKELEGHLDLRSFINLEELDCRRNKLTSIDLSSCYRLKKLFHCCFNQLRSLNLVGLAELEVIEFPDNYLENFDYSSLNPNKLTYLNISDNNLPEQDLSVFKRFTNLELLWIGNGDEERIKRGTYNRFVGSLQNLENMNNLNSLFIPNTNIDSGLEYLPKSLQELYCNGKLADLLKDYKKDKWGLVYHDYQAWRKDNCDLINQIRENEKLVVIIKAIDSVLARHNQSSKLSRLEKIISMLNFYCEEKIIIARKRLYKETTEAQIEIPPKTNN